MNKKFWLFGTHLTILEEAEETNGRYDLVLGKLVLGVETPLHVHHKYAESIYVVAGNFIVYMDGKFNLLGPGENIFIPIGVPHAVACIGDESGTALTIASPSGFASLIRQLGIAGDETSLPSALTDMGSFEQLSVSIGDEILAPPGIIMNSNSFRNNA